jgi:hypothetical protein
VALWDGRVHMETRKKEGAPMALCQCRERERGREREGWGEGWRAVVKHGRGVRAQPGGGMEGGVRARLAGGARPTAA